MADPADFLWQLADYLETQGIGYATAQPGHPVDIFVNKQQPDPDNCITLLGEVGPPANPSVPELMFPRFQVLVRNSDYQAGSAKLRAVRTALHDKLAISLQNFFCYVIRAEQEGYPIGEDDRGRPEFSIHFGAEIRYGDSI